MEKIGLFYPKNILAGWYSCGGYVKTLQNMGYEVIDAGLPGNDPHDVEAVRAELPKIEDLNKCDLILSMYHEYVTPWLEQLYNFEEWSKLTVPIIGRFDESFDRPDLLLNRRWDSMKRWAHLFSFPAAQDAETYKGQWLPFGVDPLMFNSNRTSESEFLGKSYDLAFIGTMYQIRLDYLQRLAEHIAVAAPGVMFRCAPCIVQDLSGARPIESTQLLAENYRQIKIFFCLPPMSKLIVAKVADVMSCETFVMYPKLPYHARVNMSQFEHKKHIVYYDPGYVAQNAAQIAHYLKNEEERETIAQAGRDLVNEKYTLEKMLVELISLREQHHQANVIPIRGDATVEVKAS